LTTFGYNWITLLSLIMTFRFLFLLVCFICFISTHIRPPVSLQYTHHQLTNIPTAVAQYQHLNCLPLHFCFKRSNSTCINTGKYDIITLLVLLSGDVHQHPGPATSTINLGTLNIRSLFQENRSIAIHDLISTNNIDILALTETFQNPNNNTPAQLMDIIPPGFQFFGQPRQHSSPDGKIIYTSSGGLGILCRDNIKIQLNTLPVFSSFESQAITAKFPSGALTIYNVYRPPDSSSYASAFTTFLSDFSAFLTLATTTPHEFLITGDFNIHVNKPSDPHASQFNCLLASHSLQQHVSFPTHIHENTLDLLITPAQTTINPTVSCSPASSPSDHFLVMTSLNIIPPPPKPVTLRSFRRIASINTEKFIHDIEQSSLITDPPEELDHLVNCYNNTLSTILDNHAPVQTKHIRATHSNPWFTPALQKLKEVRRKLERKWKLCNSSFNLLCLRKFSNLYHKSILAAKKAYHSNLIETNKLDPRKLWQAVNSILHRNSAKPLPQDPDNPSSISNSFSTFFSDKITQLQSKIPHTTQSPHTPDPATPPASFSTFRPATVTEITRLIHSSENKQCDLDPIPTSLLKQCSSVLAPTITNIINISLATGCFPSAFKQSTVTPLIKKPHLDSENFSNYRPISNLSFISKLTERVVKDRLQAHLSGNSLYNIYQSAYTKFHSTETALLALYDHLIRASTRQNITCLCLLDLSAAFDTIDHAILLQRLTNWFGITGPAHSWLQSYLTSRSFSVLANGFKSASTSLSCGIPQGSVLGPLLFILYTTPLSSLLSSTTVSHHLYADDTQLFISFLPSQYSTSINQLQSVFSQVSSWMSANLLSLNPSKTEFLVIGLPQQTAKVNDPSLAIDSNNVLQPVTHARNLGFLIDNNLSFDQQISALSRSCSYHLRDLRRIRPTLNFHTANIIATSLVQSKLDYCNSLYLNLPAHCINKLQVIQNNMARAITSKRKFDHISPTLHSLHWLKIKERINYKVISLTYSALQSGKPHYLRDLITLQSTRSTRSGSLITLSRPPASKLKISNRSFYYMAPVLWNSLPAHLRQPASPSSDNSQQNSTLALSRNSFLAQLKTYLFKFSHPP